MFLTDVYRLLDAGSLPHERGGVSCMTRRWPLLRWSSPRAWGCFPATPPTGRMLLVFPTSVGVFPSSSRHGRCGRSLPHERGGVSDSVLLGGVAVGSSPRAWGCFSAIAMGDAIDKVFPTSVGVFLNSIQYFFDRRSLPHERGGVSMTALIKRTGELSSPRAWGCF